MKPFHSFAFPYFDTILILHSSDRYVFEVLLSFCLPNSHRHTSVFSPIQVSDLPRLYYLSLFYCCNNVAENVIYEAHCYAVFSVAVSSKRFPQHFFFREVLLILPLYKDHVSNPHKMPGEVQLNCFNLHAADSSRRKDKSVQTTYFPEFSKPLIFRRLISTVVHVPHR